MISSLGFRSGEAIVLRDWWELPKADRMLVIDELRGAALAQRVVAKNAAEDGERRAAAIGRAERMQALVH